MRKGNSVLKTTLCEVAGAAINTNSQFKDKYKTLTIRRGYKRSVMAIAHKMLRVVRHVLIHKKHYKDPGIDYEKLMVTRNAPRWIQQLSKYRDQLENTVTKKVSKKPFLKKEP